ARVEAAPEAARCRPGHALRRERVGGGLPAARSSSLIRAEEREARLEALDRDVRAPAGPPPLARELELRLAERLATRADVALAGELVAELLRNAGGGDVALDRSRARPLGAKAREGELEHCCAHLGPVA